MVSRDCLGGSCSIVDVLVIINPEGGGLKRLPKQKNGARVEKEGNKKKKDIPQKKSLEHNL